VHRPKYDDWSFPKGKSELGEHVLLTATREVAEEAAVRVVLGRRLNPSEYEVDGRPKLVSYWAARCVEAFDFVPNHEVDDLAWIDLPHVAERLSYDRDRILIEEFAAGPLSTIPLILLRHAQAGTRSQDGLTTDLARPLDSHGTQDAQLLAELLVSYGPCRVITSAAERCIATVRPYAEAVGMPVETEPDFTTAGQDEDDVGAAYLPAARRAVALVAQRQPMLICAHRENLPVILDAARTELNAGEDGRAEPPIGKGSFVVLQSADGVLVSSEHHDLTDLARRSAAPSGVSARGMVSLAGCEGR
jgi:phosphohistidine phosphatase SixA/ADP-ribose pyrophosphatase YjhB (NUDIX family)